MKIIIVILSIFLVGLLIQNDKMKQQIQECKSEFWKLSELLSIEKNDKKNDQQIRQLLKRYITSEKSEISLITVESIKKKKLIKNDFMPNLCPIEGDYAISQKYSKKHPAVDYAAPTGTPVIAAASGVIISIYEDEYFGKSILVNHFDYITFYAHLSEIFATKNEFVKKGQQIAKIGNTGFSSAPHLHFEIIKDGKSIELITDDKLEILEY
ncbi:MAG: M23 family metallopeptidase [Candidatus Cloacimonetes bacterium]|jgi:murein DD-endopeptidase MepM/ murein hydrolase activator NlpD|nr:M23 family metallopeptidase [Candidatus Cloacimonadota bacterium]MBT6994868.1 M23 family metallopeptidase [Candidatus Cloacimonadota bacterium]MBT7468803.1 M23 family metallopeptidase [Candidatus Cloacimonadota bacterium]